MAPPLVRPSPEVFPAPPQLLPLPPPLPLATSRPPARATPYPPPPPLRQPQTEPPTPSQDRWLAQEPDRSPHPLEPELRPHPRPSRSPAVPTRPAPVLRCLQPELFLQVPRVPPPRHRPIRRPTGSRSACPRLIPPRRPRWSPRPCGPPGCPLRWRRSKGWALEPPQPQRWRRWFLPFLRCVRLRPPAEAPVPRCPSPPSGSSATVRLVS